MIALFAMLIVICLTSFMFLIFKWLLHVGISTEYVEKWGWGNYKLFKKHFESYVWNAKKDFNGSLFSYDKFGVQICKVHSDQFVFNHVNMVMNNPISFLLCKCYAKKYFNSNYKEMFYKETRYKWE